MRIPNITSLRFFLSIIVIIFHTPGFCRNRSFPYFDDWPILQKGKEAVFVFFVLSGFLIIKKLYIEKIHTNKIDFRKFFINRSFRILPLYYLILIFGLIYYRLILPFFKIPFDNDYNLIEGIVLSFTMFANIFSTYEPGAIIEILWSIAIEEQFYLIIAPILFFIPTRKIKISLFIISVVLFVLYIIDFGFFIKYQMLFFFFSIGGIFSVYSDNLKLKYFVWKIRHFLHLIILLYFFTNLFVDLFNNYIFYLLFSAILFSIYIYLLSLKKIPFLDSKTFNYLGDISYGIYMYHAIVIQLVGLFFIKTKITSLGMPSFIIFNLLVISITILIAGISKKYYENYFLKLRSKFSGVISLN